MMSENFEALEKYLRELAYKGLSPWTINPRRFLLKHFCQTIGKSLEEVSREDVLDWIDQKKVSRISQRNYRY